MTRRIESIFREMRHAGRAAMMPFMTAGDPSLQVTIDALPAIESAGASIVELGIPFSDPIADGPVIAASMNRALEAGVTPAAVFDAVRVARNRTSLGLVAMVSDSIVMRMGPAEFLRQASDAGVDGLIVPDLDASAGDEIADLAGEHGMTLSMLIAPNTSPRRMQTLVRLSSGFIYLLGRTGLTGERDSAPQIAEPVRMIRDLTDLPIAVGFGIATAEHVAAVTSIADAAIVGSALVRRMSEAKEPVAAARSFITELSRGLRTPAGNA